MFVRPTLLATVETVTKADSIWQSRRQFSAVVAQATAGKSVQLRFYQIRRTE